MNISSQTASESCSHHHHHHHHHALCNRPLPNNLPPHLIIPHHHHPLHNPHFHPCFHLFPTLSQVTGSSNTTTSEQPQSSTLPQQPLCCHSSLIPSLSFTPTNSCPHFHHHHHGCLAFCQRVPYHPCRRFLLPPPPCGFNSSCREQRQNHEAEVADSGYREDEAEVADSGYREDDYAQNCLEEFGDEAEDVEDGDPVFVLTEEWLEFFAKSEAKRQQDKKLKQKKVGRRQKGKAQT